MPAPQAATSNPKPALLLSRLSLRVDHLDWNDEGEEHEGGAFSRSAASWMTGFLPARMRGCLGPAPARAAVPARRLVVPKSARGPSAMTRNEAASASRATERRQAAG